MQNGLLHIPDVQEKLPRLDLGNLEGVLAEMASDTKGRWSNVVFIPPGSMAETAKSK